MMIENIESVLLINIDVDTAWNARSGVWTQGEHWETGSGFATLKASIEADGVKIPIVVRPIAEKPGCFVLVSGFRRYEAARQLGHDAIPAIVREMSDVQARLENIRENTARESLKKADLAWAVGELAKQGTSDTDIAKAIGLSQPYVSKLHAIIRDLDPNVFGAWRTARILVSVEEVYGLTKVPRERQQAAWLAVLHAQPKPDGRSGARDGFAARRKRAQIIGTAIGKMHRRGLLSVVATDRWDELVENAVPIPRRADASERRRFAQAMANGYAKAMKDTQDEDDLDDVEDGDGGSVRW
jgi:ParB/RepB/Spo0J family partition protein